MDYNPDEKWSPASWLGAFANTLYNDYLNYWELQNVPPNSELTDKERAYYRRLKEIADEVSHCLHSLSTSPGVVSTVASFFQEMDITRTVDEDLAAQVTRAFGKHPIIRDGIKIDLALQAADILLAGAEERASVLIALIANRKLSARASAYLDRATRLFLWGFEPEAIVMSASVLESAYEERFPATEMLRLQITRKGDQFEPHEYEMAALAAGVFAKREKDLATRIRRARNDTLHNAPNTVLDARKVIEDTALLLAILFPAS